MHPFAFILLGFTWHFLLNIQSTVRAVFSGGRSSLPEQLDIISKMLCSPSSIHSLLWSMSFYILPVRAALAQFCCANFLLQACNRKFHSIFLPWHYCFLLVSLMCGFPLGPISLLGCYFCCDWESFDLPVQAFASCSFRLSCLFSPTAFQSSGTFPFALFSEKLRLYMNALFILIMPFTLLFWYVGFPSAALAPSSQNLFVFIVSMPPAGILLF